MLTGDVKVPLIEFYVLLEDGFRLRQEDGSALLLGMQWTGLVLGQGSVAKIRISGSAIPVVGRGATSFIVGEGKVE